MDYYMICILCDNALIPVFLDFCLIKVVAMPAIEPGLSGIWQVTVSYNKSEIIGFWQQCCGQNYD